MQLLCTLAMTVERGSRQPFSDRIQKLAQTNGIGCMFKFADEWGPRSNGEFYYYAQCVNCNCLFKLCIQNKVARLDLIMREYNK